MDAMKKANKNAMEKHYPDKKPMDKAMGKGMKASEEKMGKKTMGKKK